MYPVLSSSHYRIVHSYKSDSRHRIKPLGECVVFKNSDKETHVEIRESVRSKDIFIIQTGSTKDPNDNLMELMIMSYACKTSCARNIIGVLPYLPYSKQSKQKKRGCIVMKLVAQMLVKAGLTHLITVDLHQKEIQGFFDIPVDNLRASPFLIDYIREQIPDWRNAVIVARKPIQAKRVTGFAERLKLNIAVIHGYQEREGESEEADGRNSPPPSSSGLDTLLIPVSERRSVFTIPSLVLGEQVNVKGKLPMDVVGDVGGRIAIIVEDMIDDVPGLVQAVDILFDRGAYKVYAVATHALFTCDAPSLIEKSRISEVIVTNTVPHEFAKLQCSKIKIVDISLLLSEAIRRIHNQESMSYLFRNVEAND
jgi:phosphoribosylpyrophosphate synthetase